MTLTVVKKNIIANFVGSGCSALLSLVLIPVYIRVLGIEAWGVIGLFASLQSLAYLVDLGLSATLNREMARLSIQKESAQEMRNLVRTFELIYWAFALAIGSVIFVLAPLIAHRWLRSNQVSPEIISNAFRLMGVALTFQWPFTLYSGGLMGLQRQVLLNAINASVAIFRSVGAVLILWLVSPTLEAFFLWQVLASLLNTCLAGLCLWGSLPHTGRRSGFQRELLQRRWRFAVGMSGIVVMSIILTQMDKIILSRLLSLRMFGYYVLAASVATSLYLLVLPVFYSLYPRFTQLVSLGELEGLKEIYHHGCQLMSILILPATMIVVFFSRQILLVWTSDPATVANTYLVLNILIAGAALNGLMHLPHALQLAHGWTRQLLYLSVVSALALIPLLIFTTSRYGTVGAALTLVILNGGVAIVNIQLMHRRLLKGEQWRWYLVDVGLPLMVALASALLCRAVLPAQIQRLHMILALAAISLFVVGSTALATPVIRSNLISFFRRNERGIVKAS
ncbi:MAG TPA: oligosaccharide flippase family protein [Pyrinomonadaceae bacterium]|nr:oligosaccharide flippase family protein [Pyrinomonadaceae bacterium]